ncbi:MAG: hypothetical protein MRY49_01155 [Candidatus Pacebacteria bacterium]|nr:hypothetical protein [Candidatus Paceibacterota bacterium]
MLNGAVCRSRPPKSLPDAKSLLDKKLATLPVKDRDEIRAVMEGRNVKSETIRKILRKHGFKGRAKQLVTSRLKM